MISKLRKKFISITAAALFAMILLVIAAINCVFIYQMKKNLDARLTQIMNDRPFGDIHSDDKGIPKNDTLSPQTLFPESVSPDAHDTSGRPAGFEPVEPKAWDFLRPFDMKLQIHSDGCLILFDEDTNLIEISQSLPERYSEEELSDMAEEILCAGKESGWSQYFRFRTETIQTAGGASWTKIGLINASADLYSVFTMLIISVAIGILSFLLVLLIIIFASGRAVKPIAESYAKQKQFVTDAGHELKTPLTVISANNELARMIYGESEWFDSIDSQITKMNSLVHSLITLARMDEEQKPDFTYFSLSDAVYDTAKSFENLIHKDGKLIIFDIKEDILYLGDESRLRQVAAILIDNAAKYCDKQGKITVRLMEDKLVRLQVINDYADVSSCDLSRVFERFYRADKARTPDGSYGLGLSITKSVVEQHKGEIQAKALEHCRLMFEVTLPRSGRK